MLRRPSGRPLLLSATPGCLVDCLKAAVERSTGLPAQLQQLRCQGRLLRDGRPLAECEVRDSSLVYLCAALRGGMHSGLKPPGWTAPTAVAAKKSNKMPQADGMGFDGEDDFGAGQPPGFSLAEPPTLAAGFGHPQGLGYAADFGGYRPVGLGEGFDEGLGAPAADQRGKKERKEKKERRDRERGQLEAQEAAESLGKGPKKKKRAQEREGDRPRSRENEDEERGAVWPPVWPPVEPPTSGAFQGLRLGGLPELQQLPVQLLAALRRPGRWMLGVAVVASLLVVVAGFRMTAAYMGDASRPASLFAWQGDDEPPKAAKGEDLLLFVGVLSSAQNGHKRSVIRSSWMQHPQLALGGQVTVKFFVGKVVGEDEAADGRKRRRGRTSEEDQLREEAERFEDVVMLPLKDSPKGRARKLLGFLRWYLEEGPRAAYVAKLEDHAYVHVDLLLPLLGRDLASPSYVAMGLIHECDSSRTVARDGFLAQSAESFPESEYPPYPDGGGYLLSAPLVEAIGQTYYKDLRNQALVLEGAALGVWIRSLKQSMIPVLYTKIPMTKNGCSKGDALTIHMKPDQMECMSKKRLEGLADICCQEDGKAPWKQNQTSPIC